MKLLRVDSVLAGDSPLVLEEVIAENIRVTHPYAILSHTWAKDEVLYQHVQDNTARQRQGFLKIKYTAEQARRDEFHYIWVDTCCIDKSSSAELQEAINSMYAWYSQAQICYAFLSDVTIAADTAEGKEQFMSSRWFTRGWTLQELLAPKRVKFYSADWDLIGVCWEYSEVTQRRLNDQISIATGLLAPQQVDMYGAGQDLIGERSDRLVVNQRILHEEISMATGIRTRVLLDRDMQHASIAERMAWASSRKTTRVEDVAYSLLGIFDVNMPLLYGEGSKAFLRLQEEIMKQSDDQTIFAWTQSSYSGGLALNLGILASSPDDFNIHRANLRDIQPAPSLSSPYLMTNKGLQIELAITEVGGDSGIVLAALDCAWGSGHKVVLVLKRLAEGKHDYIRIFNHHLRRMDFSKVGEYRSIFVRQNVTWREFISADMHRSREMTRWLLRAQNSQSTQSQFLVIKTAPSFPSTEAKPSPGEHSIFGHDVLCVSGTAAAAISYQHKEYSEEILLMFGNRFDECICFDAFWMPKSTKTRDQTSDLLAMAPIFQAHIPGEAVVLRSGDVLYTVNVRAISVEKGPRAPRDRRDLYQPRESNIWTLEVDIRREETSYKMW